MNEPEKAELKSMDVAEDKRRQLAQLFPEVITETRTPDGQLTRAVNFEKLKAVLGAFSEVLENQKERYGMTWPGKNECLKIIQQPSIATLKPCRDESVNFDTTENLFIEGDNLEVLKLIQKAYYGKVKMIYIDPPYNTGKEFIYPDKYAETLETYLAYTGQVDAEGRKFSSNTEAEGRFHSKWMGMMYPRLYLAKNLLRDDGALFVSIGEDEVVNLRRICDEVFGEECFVATFVWDGGRKNDSQKVSVGHEYIVVYSKHITQEASADETVWRERKQGIDDIYAAYEKLKQQHGQNWDNVSKGLQQWFRGLSESDPAKAHEHYHFSDAEGIYFASDLSGPDDGRKNRPRYQVLHPTTGRPVPIPSRGWRWEEPRMKAEITKNRVHFGPDETSIPNGKVYLKENEWQAPSSVFYKDRRAASASLKSIMGDKVFDFPKDISVLSKLISLICRDNDIVMDFFAGSGTIGETVLSTAIQTQAKCRFILVQLPEPVDSDSRATKMGMKTIADIGKERIRRVIKKLNDEDAGKLDLDGGKKQDRGFRVFKLTRSNFKVWDSEQAAKAPEAIAKQLELHEQHIDPSASQEDILYELLLKAGFPLTTKVEKVQMAGKDVFSVADGALLICLEREITKELIKAMAAADPSQVICLDEGFKANDQLKANAVQTFKARSQGKESATVFRTV